jgi:plastocyanin
MGLFSDRSSGSRGKRGTRRRTLVVLALGAALALSALGGGLVAAAGAARTAKTPVVINEEFQYRPGTFHVKVGSKVLFENESSYTHTATDKGVFDTGKIKPGASKQVTLTKKGTYVFHCTIHPFMTGKVIVE